MSTSNAVGEAPWPIADIAAGTPLLELVMQGGRRVRPSPPISEIRGQTARNLEQLPPELKRLDGNGEYRVRISAGLHELARQVDAAADAIRHGRSIHGKK